MVFETRNPMLLKLGKKTSRHISTVMFIEQPDLFWFNEHQSDVLAEFIDLMKRNLHLALPQFDQKKDLSMLAKKDSRRYHRVELLGERIKLILELSVTDVKYSLLDFSCPLSSLGPEGWRLAACYQ